MALRLISSNRVELLQADLAAQLAGNPLADPFRREQVIVPGMAMARWLNLQLARSLGVAANLDYSLPADWVWQLACAVLADVPEQDPLTRERAAWRLYARLPSLLDEHAFTALRQYLHNDADGVKRWQLAVRIADVYDRYQFYRPDWIRDWSEEDGRLALPAAEQWQAPLWRAISADLGGMHRVGLIDRMLERLRSPIPEEILPERITIFALSSLPPLFVDVFHVLAMHTEVLLYQHSPTDQYWADLVNKKQQARERLRSPGALQYCEEGNDLLVSWGRQGQVLQDLLLDSDALDSAHAEYYEPPGDGTLLHRLQQDIFALRDEETRHVTVDDSIQLSVCHSPLRECQVLHDRLLREMQADESLKPEDILVMVPEISRYAPYIEAVFRHDESAGRPFIPWNLSDITLNDEHPLIRVFFQLLNLPTSRFTFSEVM